MALSQSITFSLILGRSDLRGILPLDFLEIYCRNIDKINPLKCHALTIVKLYQFGVFK